MDRDSVIIYEPIQLLRSALEQGTRTAGYQPIVDDAGTTLVSSHTASVIAYVDRGNLHHYLTCIRHDTPVIALHDERSGISIATLVGLGAHAVLPRGVDAASIETALTLGNEELLLVPRPSHDSQPRVLLATAAALLTDEEREWLTAAASGQTLGAIARTTGQSERTLQRRVQHLCRQLSAQNLNQALVVAAALGLVGQI